MASWVAETVPPAVDRSLSKIVPQLMTRFSSREGYKLFDDTIPVRMYIYLRFCIQTDRVLQISTRVKRVEHTNSSCEQCGL